MENIIYKAEHFCKRYYKKHDGSHDFYHAMRVKNMVVYLSKEYYPKTYVLGNHERDICTAEIAALFHDIIDPKYCKDQFQTLCEIYTFIVDQLQLQVDVYNVVAHIILHISFSKEIKDSESWIESIKTYDGLKNSNDNIYQLFRLVSDADKLDSIGCVGLARTFQYNTTRLEDSLSYSIKLLNIKDMLYYNISKKIGKERIRHMIYFLKQLNADLTFFDSKLSEIT